MSRARVIAVAVVLLFAAMQMFAVADAEAAHGHDQSSGKECKVCHASHLPALASILQVALVLPQEFSAHLCGHEGFAHVSPERFSGFTRAPPSSL